MVRLSARLFCPFCARFNDWAVPALLRPLRPLLLLLLRPQEKKPEALCFTGTVIVHIQGVDAMWPHESHSNSEECAELVLNSFISPMRIDRSEDGVVIEMK